MSGYLKNVYIYGTIGDGSNPIFCKSSGFTQGNTWKDQLLGVGVTLSIIRLKIKLPNQNGQEL